MRDLQDHFARQDSRSAKRRADTEWEISQNRRILDAARHEPAPVDVAPAPSRGRDPDPPAAKSWPAPGVDPDLLDNPVAWRFRDAENIFWGLRYALQATEELMYYDALKSGLDGFPPERFQAIDTTIRLLNRILLEQAREFEDLDPEDYDVLIDDFDEKIELWQGAPQSFHTLVLLRTLRLGLELARDKVSS
jgi:hypothetical protein